jgi:hypothetical protein
MAKNVVAWDPNPAGLTDSVPSENVCDVCDAGMPGSTSTYPSHDGETLVMPASASKLPNLIHEEGDRGTAIGDDLDEREAMALEGGVPPAFARVFAALQVARPASVDEQRWYGGINDVGIFLDDWGGTAERLGWTARDIIGPQFTPRALAWVLKGARVVSLTRTMACLSDDGIFTRMVQETRHDNP